MIRCQGCLRRNAPGPFSAHLLDGGRIVFQCASCDLSVPVARSLSPAEPTEAASPRRARAVLAAVAVLAGCAELPPERSWAVAYRPAGAVLRVELSGAVDREQADEALRRRAIELGCAVPTVTVSGISAKVEGEKTTTTVTGAFACGRAL